MQNENRNKTEKIILINNFKVGSISILDFKLYYKAIVIRVILYWNKKHIDLWDRTYDTEASPDIFNNLFFDKESKKHTLKKDSLLKSDVTKKRFSVCRQMSRDIKSSER